VEDVEKLLNEEEIPGSLDLRLTRIRSL